MTYLIFSWQRFNLIAPDNSDGSNSIEELKKAVERMPAEFRDYVTVGESIRYPAGMFLPLTGEDYEAVMNNLNAIQNTGNRINILYFISLWFHSSFADPIQAAAFLYVASQKGMIGAGWVYIGTNWNTMQTYAGLAPEYRDIVREAMNGMVGISPFIGNVNALDKKMNVFIFDWPNIKEYVNKHPEIQEQAKELCGQEIVIKEDLYPEYVVFVYDSVITVAKGMQAVLDNNPNATFLYDLSVV